MINVFIDTSHYLLLRCPRVSCQKRIYQLQLGWAPSVPLCEPVNTPSLLRLIVTNIGKDFRNLLGIYIFNFTILVTLIDSLNFEACQRKSDLEIEAFRSKLFIKCHSSIYIATTVSRYRYVAVRFYKEQQF